MRSLIILVIVALFSGFVFALNTFQQGHEAYEQRDYARAFELLQPLAQDGNGDAQNILGKMYGLGHGVPKDETAAMKWIKLAAGNGNLEAQEVLASLAMMEFYEKRQEVEDKEQKIKWITSSAERGNVEAMNMLGMLYSAGNGLPMTTIEAEKWYCRAIKKGHPTAARNLGLMMAGTLYYLERVKKPGDKIDRPPCSNVE